jgi:hypothetical protein
VKAFNVSPTSANGYSALGVPTGRYLAPADSFDCIEAVRGEGKCGVRSLVVTGPMYRQFDISVVKRIDLVGRINAEIRVDALNVLNHVNFAPVSGLTTSTTDTNQNFNRMSGDAAAAYEITDLTGTNTFRVVQIVSRIRW